LRTSIARSISRQQWNVATATLLFSDPSRSTPARGEVPAHPGRALRTVLLWRVTPSGALAPGRHALVVFAHGFAVQTATYHLLLNDVTRAGLIVAAPELPGETSASPGVPNEQDLVNEPCDLKFVAASLKLRPPQVLAAALATAPVVFAGHSDGATAAAAAGYSMNACPGPTPAAIVALSSNNVSARAVSEDEAPPLLAVTGTDDKINPAWNTAALWLHVPGRAWLLTVEGGSHLGTFTTDPDRARVDGIVSAFIIANTIDPRAAIRMVASGRLHLYRR